jgi:glycosyltransferase involved in cell wall biosynthesis
VAIDGNLIFEEAANLQLLESQVAEAVEELADSGTSVAGAPRHSAAVIGKPLRMAIVHPWVYEVRGGEKVFFEIARTFPTADLFMLFGRHDHIPEDLRSRLKGTSFLQKLQWWRLSYRSTLPFLPAAAKRLDLSDYDVVISSSSGWAHGVKTRSDAVHICYMHSPPRYLWDQDADTPFGRKFLARRPPEGVMQKLRDWDLMSSGKVSKFIANSETVRARISTHYGRDACIINPPVQLDRFINIDRKPGAYVLAVGELVPYKRFDAAMEACRLAGLPLVIIGDGPDRKRLEQQNSDGNCTFLGRVPDETLNEYLQNAGIYLHAGIEDFGIASVEALAAGVPVVGVARGGTGEIVGRYGVGELADSPDPKQLAAALLRCIDKLPTDEDCRLRAKDFSNEVFASRLRREVADAIAAHVGELQDY